MVRRVSICGEQGGSRQAANTLNMASLVSLNQCVLFTYSENKNY